VGKTLLWLRSTPLIDLLSITLVFCGTLLGTFLQAGMRNAGICLAELAALFRKGFDPAQTKKQLTRQIADLQQDGLVRARPAPIGDAEFDTSTSAMIAARSLDAMMAKHDACRSRRFARATTARQVCGHAAELAQVMGLAGTLIALGRMAPIGSEGASIAGAIGMAVSTTLYGVALANLLFLPLAGLIERRSRAEDEAREDVFAWLEMHAHVAAPRLGDLAHEKDAA